MGVIALLCSTIMCWAYNKFDDKQKRDVVNDK